MENEFLPYEQASALKELGFDEKCLATYNSDKKVSRNPSHNMEDLPIEGQPYYWQNSKIYISCITAPLYQQAFRWFREKYNLDCSTPRKSYPTKFDGRGCNKEILYSIKIIEKSECLVNEGYYKTFEKAELECLKKLIEIVKNK